jgi:hypothetical protein
MVLVVIVLSGFYLQGLEERGANPVVNWHTLRDGISRDSSESHV